MDTLDKCLYKLTHCDTGARLNPLMHIFIYVALAFSLAMLTGGASVMDTALYAETAQVGASAVSLWGIVGLVTVIAHLIGFGIRAWDRLARYGIYFIEIAMFGGIYMWLWAAVVYLSGGFMFQFFVYTIPNLMFWSWYAWQWRRRYTHRTDKNFAAFVN